MSADPEHQRLDEARLSGVPWRKWGPYLSERQWGTVREDYSDAGAAWDYFPHDHARSRAYRWGEDGLAGVSDDKQRLCFALALWNGADPILKERLFGLTNSEGNHGEDVKEYYFYLDSTPTHSYMKYLYKYPQAAYPYADLVRTNRERSRHALEYELLDTGVFAGDRYWDVFVEYAKASPEDLLIAVSAVNRGREAASLHILPHLWFRNTWWWTPGAARPRLHAPASPSGPPVIAAAHAELGDFHLTCEGSPGLYFTENETNTERCFGAPNAAPYVKDGINARVVEGRSGAVNPGGTGTKAAAHYRVEVPGGASAVVRLRLRAGAPVPGGQAFGAAFDETLARRRREADLFYGAITPETVGEDARNVMRQALAGMLWSKQYYFFDLDRWLDEHQAHPIRGMRRPHTRNREWFHMVNDDVISMPDKWEYPWYAAWDLAFHTIALAAVDLDFAKGQLDLMLRELYLHPNGQIPAYEWNFGDVNPPVHAWATLFIYHAEKEATGRGDIKFLEHAFQKLLLNFTWWLNRKDPSGRNVFEGGFLGLDNIGVFDRSAPLPTGGRLEQADGTAWMALFAQNMLEIAIELALHEPVYESMATKFLEHFFWIAASMDRIGDLDDEMWDEADGFFYDVLRLPDGRSVRLKVRSLVGLLPLCATTVISREVAEKLPGVVEHARRFLARHSELIVTLMPPGMQGEGGRGILSILNEDKLRRVLRRMLDEGEFLGPHGIRSVSRAHLAQPYAFRVHGEEYAVQYQPAESTSGMFGGNSNWRGPVWFPINLLVFRALVQLYSYYGDAFTVECPTGSGRQMTLFEVARELASRLVSTFLRDEHGRRPVYGGAETFQTNPHFRDLVLFYEYFHGDNGAGIGASHQTGWTGVVARLIQFLGMADPAAIRERGARARLTFRRESAVTPDTSTAS